MSRVYMVMGIAAGQAQTVIANLPNTEYRNGDDGQGRRLEYTRGDEVYSILILDQLADNVPLDGQNWDVWLLAADSRDAPGGHWRWLTRAVRFLRRESAAHPGYILGPYSIAKVREQWPAKARVLLNAKDENGDPTDNPYGWNIIFGDDPASCEAVDYRPTQQEIDEDIEADPAVLFPGEP